MAQQITQDGIANLSGLEVFSSVINYTGEYINWGDAFAYGTSMGSDTDYATTAADPHTDALINSPASIIGKWYRYHTSGSPYTAVSAPTTLAQYFLFYGQKTGGLDSYSGIYQKLPLTESKEYQIKIQSTITPAIGTLYVKTYTPSESTYVETSSSSITLPIVNASTGIVTSNFTSETANDIILIYFTTEETSAQNAFAIANISIQEKQEYLIPVYAEDVFGNAHKVLRRNINSNESIGTVAFTPPPDPVEELMTAFSTRVAADGGGSVASESCLTTILETINE